MNPLVLIVLGAIVLVLVIIALSAIRVVQQYERGVIFVLGRLIGAKGPGLFLVPPFISRMMKVDLRIVTLTVPPPGDLADRSDDLAQRAGSIGTG